MFWYLLLAGMLVPAHTLDHPEVLSLVIRKLSGQAEQHRNSSGDVATNRYNFLPINDVQGTDWEHLAGLEQDPCSAWNATIVITASYIMRTVEADLKLISDPGCETYEVHLWEMLVGHPGYEPCINGMVLVMSATFQFSDSNHVVTFENVTAGNYCVRITPCPPSDCLTLYSKVVELPEMISHEEAVLSHKKPEEDYYFLFLLLPFGLVVFIGYLIYYQKKRNIGLPHITSITKIVTAKAVDSTPVIKVVYSRDSPQHNEAVACLCRFLEKEVNVRVVYDENAHAHAHLTSDWAIAMANVHCPNFTSEPRKSKTEEKILVIESDGGLIKQDAHHNYKDLSLAVTDYTDEMYHITYNALLSRQAQALGDYCHIFVARFSYTATGSRLNLVPEKRYTLPEHMKELLSALLHTSTSQGCNLTSDRLKKMMESETYQHLLLLVDNMKNSLDQNPDLIRDKLKTIIVS
ncbi:uncharacterized protein LOC135401187 [Ornithodoros turicata]|uniref:uncharacterized protein LOC135401187 n=1 Tax=Ornithodoros turicata TaxID=34597 RepID=UPI00313A317E